MTNAQTVPQVPQSGPCSCVGLAAVPHLAVAVALAGLAGGDPADRTGLGRGRVREGADHAAAAAVLRVVLEVGAAVHAAGGAGLTAAGVLATRRPAAGVDRAREVVGAEFAVVDHRVAVVVDAVAELGGQHERPDAAGGPLLEAAEERQQRNRRRPPPGERREARAVDLDDQLAAPRRRDRPRSRRHREAASDVLEPHGEQPRPRLPGRPSQTATRATPPGSQRTASRPRSSTTTARQASPGPKGAAATPVPSGQPPATATTSANTAITRFMGSLPKLGL